MSQNAIATRFACPIDPDLEVAWPHNHSREAYLASQCELDQTDPIVQARRSIVTTLADNNGEAVTARACWRNYLAVVRGDTLELNVTDEHFIAFVSAWQTVRFVAKFYTNRQEEIILARDEAVGLEEFVSRYLEADEPSNWDPMLEHNIAKHLIALLDIHGSTTRNGAFRAIVEGLDEISTTGGLHIQRTTRRILDGLLAELFPWAFRSEDS